jgi:hypothetical protein
LQEVESLHSLYAQLFTLMEKNLSADAERDAAVEDANERIRHLMQSLEVRTETFARHMATWPREKASLSPQAAQRVEAFVILLRDSLPGIIDRVNRRAASTEERLGLVRETLERLGTNRQALRAYSPTLPRNTPRWLDSKV